MLYLGWGPLDLLAKLLLKVLLWLHGGLNSYGAAIIALTLMVRTLFWPVSMRANRSMNKMKALQPKLVELREKYKSQPQIMSSKQMELYREAGVSPLGGCLPILLQIPVFIALYQTLDGAVQLRQEAFLWINDLAAPDTIFSIFGLPVHPLALAMTGLMVLQQHLTPTGASMDGMTRKIMMLMPLIMLVVFYNLPSGLTLYWTVSSMFGIGQMLLQRKLDAKANLNASAAKPAAAKK